ncbi:MAG: hypothetical protein P4M00_24525 [Azospirillaceae bacterium]|nr:hypothetical protein [Azospirillaceae bacterium]
MAFGSGHGGDAVASSAEAQRVDAIRNITMITYILYGIGIFIGITSIIGIIIAYLRRAESAGTIYQSHFTWLIRTFWIGLVIGFVGIVTSPIGIGFFVLLAIEIWVIFRIVKGFLKFNDRKEIPNPRGFF